MRGRMKKPSILALLALLAFGIAVLCAQQSGGGGGGGGGSSGVSSITGDSDLLCNSASTGAVTLSRCSPVTLPNGTVATTQTAGDSSTKVSTTAYANAAVAAPALAHVDVVGSSSSIAATTLFTPTVSGLYTIHWYFVQNAVCATPGVTGNILFTFNWTNDVGAQSVSTSPYVWVTTSPQTNDNVAPVLEEQDGTTFDIWAQSGTAIQYATNYGACSSGTATYNFHVSVTAAHS